VSRDRAHEEMVCPSAADCPSSPPWPMRSNDPHSKPQLLTWLTCDAVHIDAASGKHTLLGAFCSIKAHHYPVTHPHMVWFLTITDCAPGNHHMRISMGLEPTKMQTLLERPFESQSPLHRINLINEIRNLTFPQPGEYSLLVEIDEEPLLATSLTLN